MAAEWFVRIDDVEYGPLQGREVKLLAEQGRLSPDSSVRRGKNGEWVSATKVQGLSFRDAAHEIGVSSQAQPNRTPASPLPVTTPKRTQREKAIFGVVLSFILLVCTGYIIWSKNAKQPTADRNVQTVKDALPKAEPHPKSETDLLEERWSRVSLLHVDAKTKKEDVIKALGRPDYQTPDGTLLVYWSFNAVDDKNQPTNESMFSASFSNETGDCLDFRKYRPFIIANSPVRVRLEESKMFPNGVALDMLQQSPAATQTLAATQSQPQLPEQWSKVEKVDLADVKTLEHIERLMGKAESIREDDTRTLHSWYLFRCTGPEGAATVKPMLMVRADKDGRLQGYLKTQPVSVEGRLPTFHDMGWMARADLARPSYNGEWLPIKELKRRLQTILADAEKRRNELDTERKGTETAERERLLANWSKVDRVRITEKTTPDDLTKILGPADIAKEAWLTMDGQMGSLTCRWGSFEALDENGVRHSLCMLSVGFARDRAIGYGKCRPVIVEGTATRSESVEGADYIDYEWVTKAEQIRRSQRRLEDWIQRTEARGRQRRGDD